MYMINRYEQVCAIGEEELRHRIALVREMMAQKDVTLLLVMDGTWEGYSHWLVGTRTVDTILVPMEGKVLAIRESGENGLAADDNVYPHIDYRTQLGREDYQHYFSGLKEGRCAIVQPEMLLDSYEKEIRAVCPQIQWVDCTQKLDVLKAQKSAAELACIKKTNVALSELMLRLRDIIRPGCSIRQLNCEARFLSEQLGGGGEKALAYAMQYGPDDGAPLHYADVEHGAPDYVLKQGDRVFMMLESNSEGGLFSAIGRNFILGEPSEQTKKYWEMAVRAQKFAAQRLRPGKILKEIFDENCEYIAQCGFLTNRQNYLHSFGYVFGERPYLHDRSETEPLREGMHYIVHPHIRIDRGEETGAVPYDDFYCVDTYYITPEGGVCANSVPKELFVIA